MPDALKGLLDGMNSIRVQRSELELWVKCPLWSKLDREQPFEDADADRMKRVGLAFHPIMDEYMTELVALDKSSDAEALNALAVSGPADLQPDLLHCAKLTGPRLRIWGGAYIAHERQYSYTMDRMGPKGEQVILTCCPDLVLHGHGPGELWLPDWKTGWGKTGFDFQAMFYSAVLWRTLEDVHRVCWQPFFCRFGTWGPRYEYADDRSTVISLQDAENIVRAGVMQYLQDDERKPSPGLERCRICPYKEQCPAEQHACDVDATPTDYVLATEKLREQVKAREAKQKAYVTAHGPIELDGHWYGINLFSERPTCRLRKGKPGYVGEEPSGDE